MGRFAFSLTLTLEEDNCHHQPHLDRLRISATIVAS